MARCHGAPCAVPLAAVVSARSPPFCRAPQRPQPAHDREQTALTNQIVDLGGNRGSRDRDAAGGKADDRPKSELTLAREKMAELRTQKDTVHTERRELFDRRDRLSKARERMFEDVKKLRDQMRYRSVEQVDVEISRLEMEQQTTSMSLVEEKALLKEIDALKASRRAVGAYADSSAELDKSTAELKELRKEIGVKTEKLNKLKADLAAVKEAFDAARGAGSEAREELKGLYRERQTLRKQKTALVGKIRAVRNEFYSKNDVFYNYLREFKKRKADYFAKQDELRAAEIQARKAEAKAAAAMAPVQKKMQTCDQLITYLNRLSPATEEEKAEAAAVVGGVLETREVVADDSMVVLTRTEEDFMVMGGGVARGKKGRRKKKGNKRAKKMKARREAAGLAHGFDTLDSFAKLAIEPPTEKEAIPATIEALAAKKTELKAKLTELEEKLVELQAVVERERVAAEAKVAEAMAAAAAEREAAAAAAAADAEAGDGDEAAEEGDGDAAAAAADEAAAEEAPADAAADGDAAAEE
eukprot:PLAT8650.1.p3 GENE.PLAT8650.1~~PLAT8650.1.p3  ORF type:complete len:539 (+),score=334.82 PLAT8650.1:31-1617(+)